MNVSTYSNGITAQDIHNKDSGSSHSCSSEAKCYLFPVPQENRQDGDGEPFTFLFFFFFLLKGIYSSFMFYDVVASDLRSFFFSVYFTERKNVRQPILRVLVLPPMSAARTELTHHFSFICGYKFRPLPNVYMREMDKGCKSFWPMTMADDDANAIYKHVYKSVWQQTVSKNRQHKFGRQYIY